MLWHLLFKRRRQTREGAEPLQLGTPEERRHPQKSQGVWHGGLACRQGKSCRIPSGSELPSPLLPRAPETPHLWSRWLRPRGSGF